VDEDQQVVSAHAPVESSPAVQPLPVPPKRVRSRAAPRPQRQVEVRATTEVAKPEVEGSHPLMVKLMTDDPNVVIYWIVDPKGGSE